MRFLTLTPSELLPDHSTSHNVSIKTTEELSQVSGSTLHRSSPIHPLLPEATVPDLGHGVWRLHFLVTDDPFSLLGKLSNHAYPNLESSTWFGIGDRKSTRLNS